MYPEILRIGDFVITSFGLMMFLSFLGAAWITGKQLERYGMAKEIAWDILAWIAIGGILGAKIYFLILNYRQVMADPSLLYSRGGLVWYGGFIGGVTALFLQARAKNLPLATMYDANAPGLALGYAIGRLGCFLVGDDYGRYTEGPFGVAFPKGAPESTAGNLRSLFGEEIPAHIPDSAVVTVHPTQLYEIGLALIMLSVLWRLGRERGLKAGQLFAVYLAMYGVERFMIEFVRAKSDRVLFGLSTSQLASIAMLLLAAFLWWRQGQKGKPTPLVTPGSARPRPAPARAG